MRLTAFTIENLRAIAGPLTFDGLGGIEVLRGPNNAGKSSVLSGLAFALFLARHPSAYGAGPDLPEGNPIPAPPQFVHLRPHRARVDADTRLQLCFEGGPVSKIELTLRPYPWSKDFWMVRGAWWAPESPTPNTEVPPPGVPRCVLLDATIAAEQEAALIRALRGDRTGEVRKRWRAVDRALQLFVPELGPGQLSDLDLGGPDEEVELAWLGEDDRPRPFREEGSGLRHIKDIVVGSFGSDAPIVLIEEPERNLAADAEQRLKTLFHRLAGEGRQLLITSHVHGFDGPKVWRLQRDPDGVRARRSDLPDRGPLPEQIDSESAILQAEHAATGEPYVGFVSRSGLTRLPGSLVREIDPPTTVTWTRKSVGVYGLFTLAAMEAAEAGEE